MKKHWTDQDNKKSEGKSIADHSSKNLLTPNGSRPAYQ